MSGPLPGFVRAALERRLTDRSDEVGWRRDARRSAAESLLREGLPTLAHEDWRFTSLERLVSADLDRGGESMTHVTAAPAGVRVMRLRTWLSDHPDAAQASLEARLPLAEDPFVRLDRAVGDGGVVITVVKGQETESPLRIEHVLGPQQLGVTRVVVVLEPGARATVLETVMGGRGAYANIVTDVHLGRDAQLEHVRLVSDSAALHVGRLRARVGQDASLTARSVVLGGALARVDVGVDLAEPGAAVTVDGLYVASESQHVDHHIHLHHRVPHTKSDVRARGIVGGSGRAVFNGHILVDKQAPKSDAQLSNKNLLLSKGARVHTQPRLEIFTDDVKCSHGATVGQIDPAQIFYLRSRGLSAEVARRLLVHAFASELTARLPVADLRDEVDRWLLHHMGLAE